MDNYILLEQEITQISQIENLLSILYWDIAVNMPSGAAESRTNELIVLSSIIHSKLKSDKISELINQASTVIKKLDAWQLANFKEIKKKVSIATCIDDELQKRYISSTTKCELAWRKTKNNNDYQEFKPYLQKVLSCVQEIATAKATVLNCSKYDALIDTYDPDQKFIEITSNFSFLKEAIPTLIQEIVEKQSEKTIFPIGTISINQQKLIVKRIMEIMEFDFTRGRLDESTHPFCGGAPFDIRLTTRYDESNFLSGIMGVVHETGHALYEQNLPAMYTNQPVGNAKGTAIHESQSLLMEMQIGKSKEFMEFLAKLLRNEFGFKGKEYSGENLYNLATKVQPSFIRVNADEVTYPMHILLRVEIEEKLINDDLSLDDMPNYWNTKMQQYLGIIPTTNSEGCLQDIHWPLGDFGYFPAYTNGAIIASMLMKKAKEINPNIKQDLINGKFTDINNFLNKNIRNIASLKTTPQLIQDATGEKQLNSKTFLDYLKQKYL